MKRMESGVIRFFCAALLVLFVAGFAYGQLGRGVVVGTVTDPSGAVVPAANVTLTSTATGVLRTAQTDAQGTYRFEFTDVGTYNVRVSAKGFADYELDGLVVTVGQSVSNDVRLELATTGTLITVEAEGVQMANTTNAEISDLINRTTIQNLPLEVRDTTVFVNLVPGSVPNEFNGSTRGASINGMRGGMGNFMVDGTDNNEYGQGGRGKNTPGSLPGGLVSISPEAVQEFRVVTDNFSAEYGRQGGFVTDLVLKSGTNNWHGSAFEYNRNSDTTSADFFSAENGLTDVLIRNQFGGSVGGPIKKDKMFIFAAVEFQRLRQTSPYTGTGVTPEFVDFVDSGGLANFYNTNGILPVDCSSASNPGCTLGPIFKQLNGKYPMPVPTSRFTDMGASPILGPIEYPVNIFGQATFPQKTAFNETRMDYRYDYQIGPKDSLTSHYLFDNYPTTTTGNGGDFINPAFGTVIPGRAQNASLGWTHTISPTMVNELKATYLRAMAKFPAQDPEVPSIGSYTDPLNFGFGTGSSFPQFGIENTFQYQDNMSITHGRHTFKLGGEYRRTRNGSEFGADENGLFGFWDTESLLTDGAIGDIAGLGGWYLSEQSINPSSPTPALPNYYRGFRANELGWYVEDTIKASKRVTLTLGLRYDYFGVPHNYLPGLDSNFYMGASNYNQCIVRNANSSVVCYPGDPSIPSGASKLSSNPNYPVNAYTAAIFGGTFQQRNHDLWNKDPNNFAPRFGIAWDVSGNHKTVIRTGGGVFFDRMYNNIFENMRFNAPFFAFAAKGYGGDGTFQGPISTPGFYSVPVNVANFAGAGATPSGRQIDSNLVAAYSEQVNFDVQHEFANNWLFDVAYVGTFGHKLLGLVNVNTFDGRTVSGLSTRRINPNVTSNNMRGNWWDSNYNALQAKVSRRFSHGLQFEANYTWSHALDYVSDAMENRYGAGLSTQGNPEDNYNRALEYGAADFDLRQRLVAYGVWDLPVFKANKWLGGWSLDGTFMIQSGSPFSIDDLGFDANQDGTYADRGAYFGSGSPMGTVTHAHSPADGYITNTAAFGDTPIPASTGWANGLLARNVMTGPKYGNSDLSISKKFQFRENLGLKVIASAFNFLNHPNFGLPVGDLSNVSGFGASTSTIQPNNTGTGSRVFQFGARLDF